MFGMFKKPPKNPLDLYTADELRTFRVRLERNRSQLLDEIKKLEAQKVEEFQRGAAAGDPRERRIAAQRIKETEEQIRQIDRQVEYSQVQLLAVSRLTFLKRNREQMTSSGLDTLLNKFDNGELKAVLEQDTVTGAVAVERLNEMTQLLGEALSVGFGGEEDAEITRLMYEMERASLGAADLPDLEAGAGLASGTEPRDRS